MKHPPTLQVLVLEVASGPSAKSPFRISEGEKLIVGRCRTVDCWIMDPRLSREHFSIQHTYDQSWVIQDLDSANGTFLAGERIRVSKIEEGDCIEAGDTQFLVTFAPGSHE